MYNVLRHNFQMKKFPCAAILGLLLAFTTAAPLSAKTVTLPGLPGSVSEFIKMRNQMAKTPEGGAALFVSAMIAYSKDRDLGMKLFTIALDRRNVIKSRRGVYKGYRPAGHFMYFIKRLNSRKYLASCYILGTSPSNGYALPSSYKLEITRNRYSKGSDGSIKVFVKCSGADSPRPLRMKKNNRGIWKVKSASSLFVGIRKPASTTDDDL